jgi:hypothetical protein
MPVCPRLIRYSQLANESDCVTDGRWGMPNMATLRESPSSFFKVRPVRGCFITPTSQLLYRSVWSHTVELA